MLFHNFSRAGKPGTSVSPQNDAEKEIKKLFYFDQADGDRLTCVQNDKG